ncbi:MAG: hypothetical protein H6Q14_1500 [Bacteroidetes bacterium]|nr:hypothetical protein [Bacteroidota bacterium]
MENIVEKYYFESVKGIDEAILKDQNAWYQYILNLPVAQQIVYTIVLFHSQIENGGFHQYFFNAYGQFVFLTLKNLKLIGSENRHNLLVKALEEVNNENWDEEKFRELVFTRKLDKVVNFEQKLFDYLNELDNEYYNLENEEIEELLTNYLESR